MNSDTFKKAARRIIESIDDDTQIVIIKVMEEDKAGPSSICLSTLRTSAAHQRALQALQDDV